MNRSEIASLHATAPPGSSLYYSLLSVTSPTKQAIIALHALRQALFDTATQSRNPDLGRTKLDWWRTDIERLLATDNTPRHPVCKALQDALGAEQHQLPREPFEELLTAASTALEYDVYPSFTELLPLCHRFGSSVALLQAEVLGYQQSQTRVFAHELGVMLWLLQLLSDTRPLAQRQKLFIPEDELSRYGVNTEALLGSGADYNNIQPGALSALFSAQAKRIHDFWQRAQAALPPGDRHAQRSQLVLARLWLAWLDEVAAAGFPLLISKIELTPLRKLWLSWRAQRQIRRGRIPASSVSSSTFT